mmetsp:Transcript_24609/g.79554  ORF Transcript_24609/g.79554 Transcript_24609/m.79554 type:complete len:446 (-) Transcript_24609:2452-3789(-)
MADRTRPQVWLQGRRHLAGDMPGRDDAHGLQLLLRVRILRRFGLWRRHLHGVQCQRWTRCVRAGRLRLPPWILALAGGRRAQHFQCCDRGLPRGHGADELHVPLVLAALLGCEVFRQCMYRLRRRHEGCRRAGALWLHPGLLRLGRGLERPLEWPRRQHRGVVPGWDDAYRLLVLCTLRLLQGSPGRRQQVYRLQQISRPRRLCASSVRHHASANHHDDFHHNVHIDRDTRLDSGPLRKERQLDRPGLYLRRRGRQCRPDRGRLGQHRGLCRAVHGGRRWGRPLCGLPVQGRRMPAAAAELARFLARAAQRGRRAPGAPCHRWFLRHRHRFRASRLRPLRRRRSSVRRLPGRVRGLSCGLGGFLGEQLLGVRSKRMVYECRGPRRALERELGNLRPLRSSGAFGRLGLLWLRWRSCRRRLWRQPGSGVAAGCVHQRRLRTVALQF